MSAPVLVPVTLNVTISSSLWPSPVNIPCLVCETATTAKIAVRYRTERAPVCRRCWNRIERINKRALNRLGTLEILERMIYEEAAAWRERQVGIQARKVERLRLAKEERDRKALAKAEAYLHRLRMIEADRAAGL